MKSKLKFREFAPCIFAIIIDAMGFGLVYPVMTAIFTASNSPVLSPDVSIQLRHFYLGLGFMLYPLCMFFGTSFMADLSDKFGRKKVLMICMAGIAISFFVMAMGVVASSVLLLMLGRAFSGFMAGSQPVAQAAISDISSPADKAKNMSLVALSYCFGSVLGPLIGGVTSDEALTKWFNYATPFFIAAILSAIAFIWITISFRETYRVNKHKIVTIWRPITIFFEAHRHISIRTLAIIFLLMQVGFSIYFQFILVRMRYLHGFSNAELGAMQGVIGAGFAVGLLVGMRYALKGLSTINIAVISIILTGFGQLLSSLTHDVTFQWVLAFFIATFDIMGFTCVLTLFSDAVDENSQGWAMGIANAVMALSWAISGLGSNLLNLIGTSGLIFTGGLCLILSGIILQYKKLQEKNHTS